MRELDEEKKNDLPARCLIDNQKHSSRRHSCAVPWQMERDEALAASFACEVAAHDLILRLGSPKRTSSREAWHRTSAEDVGGGRHNEQRNTFSMPASCWTIIDSSLVSH